MRSIAITSGKGGVGKTNISANLSIALSRLNRRVVVFDADIGLANLDVVLGVSVKATLQDVVSGKCPLSQVMHEGPEGIRFIPGGSGIESLFNLSKDQSNRFMSSLESLPGNADFLIFDTGAGLTDNVLLFLEAADDVYVVVTPDPASITDGYATVKTLYQGDPETKISFVVNMVADEAEARHVYNHLIGVTHRFLGLKPQFGGYVRTDPRAVACIRARVPFVVGNPATPASIDVTRIAQTIAGEPETVRSGFFARLCGLIGLKPRMIA